MMDSSNTLSGSPLTQAELNAQLLKAARDGDTNTVGASLKAANRGGDTALMLAAHHGHTNIVSVLIPEQLDAPLLNAAQDGDTDTVSTLISTGANVNEVNQRGFTALMAAASNGHTNIVSVLIAAGANLKATNQDGDTALTLAIRGGHGETAFRLLDAMPSATPPSNRRVPDQPGIIPAEDAYNRASAEFSQGLTNILSALNEGTGRHALGTKNELLKILAGYYAPDWCGRPSEAMRNILIAMNRPPFLQFTLTNLANTVTPAFRLTKETVAEPEPSKKARRD